MSTLTIKHAGDASLRVLEGDLDDQAFEHALGALVLACDIETTGLDWRAERIGTFQLQVQGTTYVLRPGGPAPDRLRGLMEDSSVLKIFHHAMFDLRFLAHHWGVTAANVACTKIASKLVDPQIPCAEHSLGVLLRRYLGVELDKGLQRSDWAAALTEDQLRYAANDVRYLRPLYDRLGEELRQKGLLDLRDRCYAHLSTRVELEVGNFPDVFAY